MSALHVLLVDDSPTAALFLQAKLDSAAQGITELAVQRASSGEEALQLAEKTGFDLAILDVVLPGVDGFHVCKQLKQQRSTCQVALLTGLQTDADKQQGVDAGCDAYIIKPIDDLRLSQLVKLAYIRAQTVNHS